MSAPRRLRPGVAIHNKIAQAVEDISQSGLYFKQVVWKWVDEALFKSGTMHNDVLAPRDPEDAIGRMLDLLAKPDGIPTLVSLNSSQTPLAKSLYDARMDATGLAWIGMDKKVNGSLVEKMREAMKEEETLPGNDKLAHLVSFVSRHVDGTARDAIDDALADYASRKRSLRAATLSGAAGLDKLREKLARAADRLERAVARGVEAIDMAINDLRDAEPPQEDNFETETAAEIFANIVNANLDAVKKSFTSLIGKGRIANAFRNAMKDDVNHRHDGHRKIRTNKL